MTFEPLSRQSVSDQIFGRLRDAIVSGRYPAGSLVWLEPGSRHTPRGEGADTLIVVLWPRGVRT